MVSVRSVGGRGQFVGDQRQGAGHGAESSTLAAWAADAAAHARVYAGTDKWNADDHQPVEASGGGASIVLEPSRGSERLEPAKAGEELPAVRARDLYRQGEPHLRSGIRRPVPGRWRYVTRLFPTQRLAESSRAGGTIWNLRPILRKRGSESRWSQLVDGGVRHRLWREDHPVSLLIARTELRLSGPEQRHHSGGRCL